MAPKFSLETKATMSLEKGKTQQFRTMRSTERLPASCLLLGLVPHPAGVTPRAAIGDRGH